MKWWGPVAMTILNQQTNDKVNKICLKFIWAYFWIVECMKIIENISKVLSLSPSHGYNYIASQVN